MSFDTAIYVRNKLIDHERRFWFVDNYPWFPHAIKDPQAKIAADEFFNHLLQHEERFLSLPLREQRTYLRQPCDLDIVSLAKTVLGIVIE